MDNLATTFYSFHELVRSVFSLAQCQDYGLVCSKVCHFPKNNETSLKRGKNTEERLKICLKNDVEKYLEGIINY